MHKFKSKQLGAVIVEFAIILPLLAVLAIGVTELGTAFFALNTLNKAVRDGARLKTYSLDPYLPSTVTPLTDAQIIAQVQSVMNGLPSFYASGSTTTWTTTAAIPATGTPTTGSTTTGTTTRLVVTVASPPLSTEPIAGLQHARVSATYNHQLLLGTVFGKLLSLFGGGFGTSIPLSATATMRVQLP